MAPLDEWNEGWRAASETMAQPVCVVCPECSAIYTPDVEGVNAALAHENTDLRRRMVPADAYFAVVAERDALQAKEEALRRALKAIEGPCDWFPWIDWYREAGGGYEGLQAIARETLSRV